MLGRFLLISAAQTMYEIVHHYRSRHIQVCFVKLRPCIFDLFERSGMRELVGEHNFYAKIKAAVDCIQISPSFGSTPSLPGASPTEAMDRLPFRSRQNDSPHQTFESFRHFEGEDDDDDDSRYSK